MALDCASPCIAIRSSVGVELWSTLDPKIPYEYHDNLPREETKNSRSITFSPKGRYFAFSNGQEIKVLQTRDWSLQCTLPRPKAFYLKFSPHGSYLCTWEMYTVSESKPEGTPNMHVYEMATSAEVFAIVQKSQQDWEPSWANDESIFAMVVGGEALFYDLSNGIDGFKQTSRKIGGSRGGLLSVGPGDSPPFLAFYTPGVRGAPSMCKLYKYPALSQNQSVACKSFFQADRVEMLWNKRGTGLLLLTSTEVDKSGASYYGNQALHFMATKGTSCAVPLSKEGPVHCVKWSPRATEFVVVYGFMPSKAALYNLKCDVIYNFGNGPRNCAYFNPFGNLLVLAGFGNLPGNVEMWDVQKREQLANIKCPDTTYFEWNPNGEYFVTATTAPRLRISNGFKVYHYSGALMHETLWPQGQELLAIGWQQFDDGVFKEPKITKAKQEGIKSSQPEASTKVYTPPHLRLMKEGKNPEKYLPQPQSTILGNKRGTGTGIGIGTGTVTGTGIKKPPRNKRTKNKTETIPNDVVGAENILPVDNNHVEAVDADDDVDETQQPQQKRQQRNINRQNIARRQQQYQQRQQELQPTGDNAADSESDKLQLSSSQQQQQQQPVKKTQNLEKERKIRSVAKKLSDIKKLKLRQQKGETLELNQLNKIEMEKKFLEELKALKISV